MFTFSRCSLLVAAGFVLSASSCLLAAGVPLIETKEQLGLKYDLTAVAHGDAVRVTLSISDLGKMRPLRSVVLAVPGGKSGAFDVYIPMAVQNEDGKLVAWAQLSPELAERASIQVVPHAPPDNRRLFGWVYHSIPVNSHITPAETED